MDLEPVPIEHSCLGCKRYFLLHEILPLETITVEFKNYPIPIKEKTFKAILLKTIVAFMNGKGGCIFIGVDDATGQVLGLNLGRKEMDEFRLVVKHMLQKVVPAVDLVKEEEVFVEFIPVLEGKERYFYGKYVIKFIVRQGDTSKLYCISEKIQVDRKQIDIISAFRRHNLGGIEELKGIKVIQQIYEKARNPYKPFETFHKNCNPNPILPALVQRQKNEIIQKIFAESDSSQSSGNASSSKKRSFSQASDNGTIIEKIQDLDTTVKDQKENLKEKPVLKDNQNTFRTAAQSGSLVYFENVRDISIHKLINYLKNSTPAKFALQIYDENGVICVKMKNKRERDGLIENLGRDPYKRLINQFGLNRKVHLFKTFSQKPTRIEPQSMKKSPISTVDSKPFTYRLLFCNYVKNLQSSVENYLKNSININIKRKTQKTNDGIELLFYNKREMSTVYDLCLNQPHNRLLGQFWTKGAIKIQKFDKHITQKLGSGKEERSPEKRVKLQNDHQDPPERMKLMLKIEQQQRSRKTVDVQCLQLIASSLQPSEVSKLSNYLVNNMFYNIQKKIFASKDRYYFRIVFNNTDDCREFMRYCMLDQHKYMLAQLADSKAFRIGVPGENLIISPYSESIKDELKKLIVKVLGMSAVKKSTVKEFSGSKVWVLTLIDPSKVLECYEKLEAFFRKQGLFINNEWHRLKVFLDYLNLSQQ